MRQVNDSEWAHILERKPAGGFLIGVVTTGIFCRTACPARTPKRINIRLLPNAGAALAAGFRPCLRCRPLGDDPLLSPVIALARAIEADPGANWDLAAMADVSGLSRRTLRYRFVSAMGLSPLAFRDAVRLRKFKQHLRDGDDVTGAGYEAGYGGPASRHAATRDLGMTPTIYAAGADGVQIEVVAVPTPLGTMVVGATERGICYLQFDDSGADPLDGVHKEFPRATLINASPNAIVADFAAQVCAFLTAGGPRPDLPVDLYGTAFQQRVWMALRQIPQGQTRTYGQLAEDIGHPGAARAVGSANARNRVAVLVPCHLVVATGGKLGGYAGGLDRKRALLRLEGV